MTTRGPANDATGVDDMAEVIDLRATQPVDVRDTVVAGVARLADLLADGIYREDEIFDVVIALADARAELPASDDPRVAAWCGFITALSRVGEQSTYVGMFKVRVDETVVAARALSTQERATAACAILDRTAAMAANAREFRHGILAARTLDPHAVTPHTVVDSVLRPCLEHADGPNGQKIVSYGLSATLAVLASGDGACVSTEDSWALSAACHAMPPSLRDPLREQVSKLTGHDRRLVEPMVDPDAIRRRRWRRRPARR